MIVKNVKLSISASKHKQKLCRLGLNW